MNCKMITSLKAAVFKHLKLNARSNKIYEHYKVLTTFIFSLFVLILGCPELILYYVLHSISYEQ